ncbi:hypothetical protein [Gluconobacter cerinus]|uniref:hypothetical protein n=1 Tax=Gluconobacter cerinus TaxID=38307 RepID=UPI000A9C06A1|nr:hypothetical protein [Gluconobacter cerinus]
MLKWLLGAFLCLLVVCSAIIGGGWFWIDQKDFSALATQKLEKATGRTVKIGSLHVRAGRWITIDAKDLHLANIPGGSRPDMVSVGACMPG